MRGLAREPDRVAKTTDSKHRTRSDGTAVAAATADAALRGLLPFAWPLFASMWLVFPVGIAAGVLRTGNLSPASLLAFLASMAAYAAVYLRLVLRHPFRGGELSASERRVRTLLLMTLAALALFLALVYGDVMPRGVPYHLMFVVIAAAVALPAPRAAMAVAAVVALAGGIYAFRSGWAALASGWEFALAPFVIVGFSMILVSRLVVTVRELEAAREEIARLAVAEERLRFARDLHDLLGHSLSLIALKSTLAGRLLSVTPKTERAANEVRDVEEVARGALREVREAVAGYRRPTLDAELASARDMLDAAGIVCHVERSATDLPPRTDGVLAWAVREGATNVVRHSRARRCEIRVHQKGGKAHAEISDDGIGFSPPSDDDGGFPVASGLSGLAERVAAGRGELEAGPLPGEGRGSNGFRLRVSLPVRGGMAAPTDPPRVAPSGATLGGDTAGKTVGQADGEATGETR